VYSSIVVEADNLKDALTDTFNFPFEDDVSLEKINDERITLDIDALPYDTIDNCDNEDQDHYPASPDVVILSVTKLTEGDN
jgi:hypothetical protein